MSEDSFEKLAKLAGASVESAGEGLPRTRAEALALGATRYSTGLPCLRGHVVERIAKSGRCTECRRQDVAKNNASPMRREYMRRYNAKPEVAEKRRLGMRKQSATTGYKELKRRLALAGTGDATLFAINQAERYAAMAGAPADIITECPEPQRGQLQALVDRIKVDPMAGKPVIGLLRKMREIRKLELADLAQATETKMEN